MPAPAPTGTTSRRPPASASRAPKAWASPASTPSRAACSPATPTHPLQVDAAGLRALVDRPARPTPSRCSADNPLVGLDGPRHAAAPAGRGDAASSPKSSATTAAPGGMFDALIGAATAPAAPPTADIAAHDILSLLLDSLSGIWPATRQHRGDGSDRLGDPAALGDCWRHSAVRGAGPDQRLDAVPQAVAVAHLLAAGALRLGRRARCAALDALTAPARIPQRRPAASTAACCVPARRRALLQRDLAAGRRVHRRMARADRRPARRTRAARAQACCGLDDERPAAGPRARRRHLGRRPRTGTALARRRCRPCSIDSDGTVF